MKMPAHRNFLLALLAATFTCIIILQITLDGWTLRGTLRYTLSVTKKAESDKISVLKHTSEDVGRNSSFIKYEDHMETTTLSTSLNNTKRKTLDILQSASGQHLLPFHMQKANSNSLPQDSFSNRSKSLAITIKNAKYVTVPPNDIDSIRQPQAIKESHRKLNSDVSQVQARIKVRSFRGDIKKRGLHHQGQPKQELMSPQARLQDILKQGSSVHIRGRVDPLRLLKHVPTVNPNNVIRVILLTYFRSGSTFVGDLLQQNWKTFYHFEPLHFMTYDSRIGNEKLPEAFHLLHSILSCNYSFVDNYLKWVKKPHNQFLFARNIFLWFSCKSNPKMCFAPEMVSAVCQRAPVQIMKVTRLHMRHLKEFMSRYPEVDTKVVYLTRDPRGVISSRRTLDWCNGTVCSDPHTLCTEMDDDITVFNELKKNDPQRFIQVLYEDMALYPERETKRLFDFLHLPFSLSVQRFLKTHTTARKADNLDPYSTRRNSSSMAFSWRNRLAYNQVNAIQDTCGNVIQQLNYTLITSPAELSTSNGSAYLQVMNNNASISPANNHINAYQKGDSVKGETDVINPILKTLSNLDHAEVMHLNSSYLTKQPKENLSSLNFGDDMKNR